MLGHQEEDNSIWFERENWKEWFMFLVSGEYKDGNYQLPKRYMPIRQRIGVDVWEYWRREIAPMVKAIYWLNSKWWRLGRYFYKKGWLKIKKGRKPNWFWLIHFIRSN